MNNDYNPDVISEARRLIAEIAFNKRILCNYNVRYRTNRLNNLVKDNPWLKEIIIELKQ